MSHSGSGSSLSTPGSQIIPCTMGSEPDLTLYFYGTAKHKPPPTAFYISQRWEYDCDPAPTQEFIYLERHLAHPRPSLHMHMHELKQSKRCKTEPSSHEGTSSAVTRLQDWTGWVWHETQASGFPSWVLSQFPAVLPHSLPVPHAFQKNGVSQRYSEDTRHHFTGITTETKVVMSPPVQITEIAMLFLHEVFYLEPSHD